MTIYTKDHAVLDYTETLVNAAGVVDKALRHIEGFAKVASKKKANIETKLSKIPAASSSDSEIVVVDPTRRLFSQIELKKVEGDLIVSMEPPLIPHFHLVLAYLFITHQYIPYMIVKTAPVVSLVAALTPDDLVLAVSRHFSTLPMLAEHFVQYTVNYLAIDHRYLDLPVEVDTASLYYTPSGLATAKVSDEPSVELDFENIPEIPATALSKFKTLREILDTVMQ